MTSSVPTAPKSPALPAAPAGPVPLPDVWEAPTTGMPWCDCRDDAHTLTEDTVADTALYLLGGEGLPDRVTHEQVVTIACEVWLLEDPCRFLLLSVEDAAVHVNGEAAPDYPLPVGLAVVKAFGDAWNGCPEEACSAG